MAKSGKKTAKIKRPYAELFKDKREEFRYRICGANGEPMVTSEGYTKLSDASDGLFALIKVFVKFDKWYAKDDDSWLRDLTELSSDESVASPPPGLEEAITAGGLRNLDGFGS